MERSSSSEQGGAAAREGEEEEECRAATSELLQHSFLRSLLAPPKGPAPAADEEERLAEWLSEVLLITQEAKQGLFKANARCARTTRLRDLARRRQKAPVRFLGGHDHERILHVLGRLAVQRLGFSSERGGC